jgi:xanthine dehydrogenase accessory factor
MSTAPFDVLAAAQRLQQQNEPCALVTVLRVQAPASARPGDKAVVTASGIAAGWIGGGCAQPSVLKTVRQALADGRARLIRIAPAEEGAMRELDDVLEFGMACHSGGTLELFVDPLLPTARLVIVGDSPVAAALAGLAPRVGMQVTVVAHGADAARYPDATQVITSDDAAELSSRIAPGAFVVVATQGRRDVQGLRAALTMRARQVSFVASERKAQVLRASLVEAGQDAAAVAAIVAPAGQAIGAQTPEEIALSVLTAVVSARRGPAAPTTQDPMAGLDASVPALTAARTKPLPLPDLPPSAASCCGGAADSGAPLLEAAPASAGPLEGSAGGPPKGSCCGGK